MQKLLFSGLSFFCLITLTFAQTNSNLQSFMLQGKISGEDSGLLQLQYAKGSTWLKDTASIHKGEFVFKGEISEPTRARLLGKNRQEAYLYLEPGILKVSLFSGKFPDFKMTGSKTQEEQYELDRLGQSSNIQIDEQRAKIMLIRDSISKIQDKEKISRLEKVVEETVSQIYRLRDVKNAIDMEFVRSHPKSYVSPEVLRTFDLNEIISLDSLKTVFSKLDQAIQNSRVGNEIKKSITKKENSYKGAFAPEFKAIDMNGATISYSDFKGKNIVVMDFWASWCGPCRKEFPHLKKLYEKYHSKGLEIIAVSTDWKKEAWISAIKEDSTENWHHVPVAARYAEGPAFLTADDIYSNYFVQAIPVQLLIDKDGKIVGRWGGYSEENQRELEDKLDELFRKN